MAQWVQNLFKFKNIYNQIYFSLEQKLAITKAIIELANDQEAQPSSKIGPEVIRALKILQCCYMIMINMTFQVTRPSSLSEPCLTQGLHYISLLVLDMVGITRDRTRKQHIKVSGFGSNCTYTMCFVNIDFNCRIDMSRTKISCQSFSNDLSPVAGRPWIHYHKVVPSTYDQCQNAILKGRRSISMQLSLHFREMRSTF